MAKAQRSSSDYSSIDDLSLPRGASAARYMEQHGPIPERSNSDSNLNLLSPQSWSSLSVDKTCFWLRDIGKTPDARVRVEWDIKEDVGAQDWIGLFYSGEEETSKFLDCKIRGSSGSSTGSIIWDLEAVEHLFSQAKNIVCFKYVSGNCGEVLASSTLVTVFIVNSDQQPGSQTTGLADKFHDTALFCLTVQDLHATNLKKGIIFNSDPYVKLQVLPHSQREHTQKHHFRELRSSVASNTANPSWTSEKFQLELLRTDLLEIEIKHKFSKSKPMMSRFLGHATIPVQTIMDCISAEQKPVDFKLELMRKGPSDNISGEVGFKANIHLLLQPLGNHANSQKNNGTLQRQSSLPCALPGLEEGIKSTAHILHRHTDPGADVAEALNILASRGIINEEQEDSDSVSAAGSNNRNTIQVLSNCRQSHNMRTFPTALHERDASYLNSEDCFTTNSETPLDSSDSGRQISVKFSCDNSSGSIPADAAPENTVTQSHQEEAMETYQYAKENLQPSCVEHDNDKVDMCGPVINGQETSCVNAGSLSRSEELDMSVQSAGIVYTLSGLRSDAPTLPPRTYKAAAPPVPPRVNKASAPPIPPRQDKPKHKPTVRSALEPPPPLPPRTYSPVELCDSGMDVTEGASDSDMLSSREQELFPWGHPSNPVSPNISGVHPQSQQSNTVTTSALPATNLLHLQRGENSVSSANCALLPEPNLAELQASHAGCHVTARSAMDGVPGSRGSLALSTVSEPPVLSLSGQQQLDTSHLKRRSVDGLAQLANSQPPRLVPRQRQLSTEERQLNRQQINQQLEQWTRLRQKSNLPTDDQSSPPSFNECELSVSHEPSSPHLPPPPSFPSNGASLRHIDSTDGQASHSGPIITQSQVPVSSNVSLPSSSSNSRERSGDRRAASVDGGEISNKRLVKYHRVDDRDDALPSGWEARVDSHGRIFYIDHVNRTTTWQRPQTGLPTVQRRTLSSEQRQQLDRRYQSIRRTMTQSQQQADAESVSAGESREATQGTNSQPDQSPNAANPPERSSERSERSVYKLPAVKFLTRPDFFPMLQANESAMVDYNRNSKLKHMITKIRREPKTFERYQHNRDLVSFVNLFCDTAKELPRRWEMKYDRSGKAFFIDHVLRTTTFMDPRLPTDVPLINPDFLQNPAPRTRAPRTELDAPIPPPRQPVAENVAAIPTAYNEKVVLFLRQPNVDDLLRDRCPQYSSSSSLREKIAKISGRGVEMLERYSNDIDLTLLLSLFENEVMSYVPPIVCPRGTSVIEATSQSSPQGSPVQRLPGRVPAPYKRDFQAKLRNFYKKLESKGYGQGPGKLKLTVRRDHVLEDAFNKIMSTPKKELQKNKLYITFAGEEGLDYGGPSREFFFLLSRELFNPYYGLFEYSANDTYTVQVSPLSTVVENAHEWFRFSGRVLGLALIHQYLLDAFFTRPFYKAVLRVPLSLEDVESLDMEFHQSLLWIKDNDISEVELDLTFSVSEEVFGQVSERELKPNGKNMIVTERNKKEYIEKMVKWRLERGVTEQTESLIRGFHEVLDGRLVSTFDARELELVIAGTVEIDITDWRRNTDYRSGYHDQHAVIQWFWEAIEKFDNERQLRLLQFVTGSSSIPYEGFSALRGSNGPRKFCIEKWGKITSLPRAHTCFNRLDLPPYTSSEMLFEKLVLAVEETSTFGID